MPKRSTPNTKPYRCIICRAKFKSHTSLQDHMREHQEPPRCKNCGATLRGPWDHYHGCQ